MPIYSFEKHARLPETTTIYSPYVLVLEGIFALHDQRVLDISDLKVLSSAGFYHEPVLAEDCIDICRSGARFVFITTS